MILAARVRAARPSDLRDVEEMLREASLPLGGLADHFARFHVACDGEAIVGASGVELYDDIALLRSVVVRAAHAGHGVGVALVTRALGAAREAGACDLYLLTTTAESYFARLGFEPVARTELPAALAASAELRGACPASATAMRRAMSLPRVTQGESA